MRIPPKFQVWIDARKRHHLSHAQVQMARELGLNPAKLGKIDNHKQEPWKLPLPQFIEYLYEKRFGKPRPDTILSIEDMVRRKEKKKAEKREAKSKLPTTSMQAAVRGESKDIKDCNDSKDQKI